MKLAVKIGKWVLINWFCAYIFLACAYLYFQQESILFHPTKLSADYQFDFDVDFEEKIIVGEDGTKLSGVLFKAINQKDLCFTCMVMLETLQGVKRMLMFIPT